MTKKKSEATVRVVAKERGKKKVRFNKKLASNTRPKKSSK